MKLAKIICALLALAMLAVAFASCTGDNNTPDSSSDEPAGSESASESEKPKEPTTTVELMKDGVFSYTLIRPELISKTLLEEVVEFRKAIADKTTSGDVNKVELKEDFLLATQTPGEYEILIGNIDNREESAAVLKHMKYNDFSIEVIGKKVVIAAYSDEATVAGMNYFIEHFVLKITDGNLTMTDLDNYSFKSTYEVGEVKIGGTELNEFVVTLPYNGLTPMMRTQVNGFIDEISTRTGYVLKINTDDHQNDHEIIIADSKRDSAKEFYEGSGALGENQYAFKLDGGSLVVASALDAFALHKALEDLCGTIIAGQTVADKKVTVDTSKAILTSFCMTDIHNCFAMLEPPYTFRKNAAQAIDNLIAKEGKVDVLMVGGDLMSDYPSWNSSGRWPYKYFTAYKALMLEIFGKATKDGKITFISGNHDYAQGELAKDGPGTKGSYNSANFSDVMQEAFGPLADEDAFWYVGKHTGDTYLLGYHFEVNGCHFVGFSPDPDKIWSSQGYGFNEDSLVWLKEMLDRIDPNGDEVIFFSCHYAVAYRSGGKLYRSGEASTDLVPILKKHKNLFYLFGHLHNGTEQMAAKYSAECVVPYASNGTPVDINTTATTYGNISGRGFTAIFMGNYRMDYEKKYFNNDIITARSGIGTAGTTATPKVSQGLYIEVYEDRIVFRHINTGTYEGYTTDDMIEPITFWRYK